MVASATYGVQFGPGMVKDTEESKEVQSAGLTSTGFRFTMQPAELGSTETVAPTLDGTTNPDATKVADIPICGSRERFQMNLK